MDDDRRQSFPKGARVSDRADVTTRIRAVMPTLRADLGVKSLALYGSFARDEANPESDVDIVVTWAIRPHFDRQLELKDRLEHLLGREVQLTEIDLLHPLVRPRAERDLIPL